VSYYLSRHFADTVIDEDPDVLLLQEVRLDTSFVDESKDRKDGGSQVQHLLWHLRQAQQRKEQQQRQQLTVAHEIKQENEELDTDHLGRSYTRYHVVFQPAMNMVAK
jgi:hypothetical protein